jgi:hypothetical protein
LALEVSPGRGRFCNVITDCAGGLGDDDVRLRLTWWVRVTLPAVALGAVGFGVGLWAGGWLGAWIGLAAGFAAGVVVGLLGPGPFRKRPLRILPREVLQSRDRLWSWDLSPDEVQAISERWRRSLKLDNYHLRACDDLVRSALAELTQPGRLLFNPPDQMRLGQKVRVEVRLTRSLELDAELLEKLQGPGEPRLEDIKTASRMAVTLTGDGFGINRYSDEEQAVTQDGITTWEFDIRAKKAGKQQLFMSVSLRIPVPGQPLVHQNIPVREATINVRITVPALAGVVFGDWRWATATAIAIAGVVVAVFFH